MKSLDGQLAISTRHRAAAGDSLSNPALNQRERLGALMGYADNLIEEELIYRAFLESKRIAAVPRGMANIPKLADHPFKFQKHSIEFGLHAGSWGCFLDTGLGKTTVELEWLLHALEASNGYGLILTPLAVARQIEREGKRWGYDIRVIREQSEARPGINVCNYDRLPLLDPSAFGAVVLDESSILKNFSGKTTMALIQAFSQHRWRMAATATPAPNDHTELGNHSEFLGVMPMNDMLVRWFINDTADTGTWRLKGHARESFWEWMASWARMAEHPRDLGDDIQGFDLPPLRIHRYDADSSDVKCDSTLFPMADVSATGIFKLKRQTEANRAKAVAEIVSNDDPWLIWCDTDSEQDALETILGDKFISVRGSQSIEVKERNIEAWLNGDKPGMISKTKIMGQGINAQHCWQEVFAGRTFSYEAYYQAVRRVWRFGQKNPFVDIHLVVAEGEDSIGRVIDRKADDHADMKREMAHAMKQALGIESVVRVKYEPKLEGRLPKWLKSNGE